MTGPCCILLAAASVAAAQPAGSKVDLRCGSYCLYVGLKALDLPVGSYEDLEERLGQPSPAGYSLGQLDEAARAYGAKTLGVKTGLENLRRRPGRFVCIAHLDKNHFVNVAALDESHAFLVDPPGSSTVPAATLRAVWDGTALLISSEPLLAEEDLPWEFPVRTMVISLLGILAGGSVWCAFRRMRSKRV